MKILKTLVIGWSITWAAVLFNFPHFRVYKVSLLTFLARNKIISVENFHFWIATYSFFVWIGGCALLFLPNLISNIFKSENTDKNALSPVAKKYLKKLKSADPEAFKKH